MDTIGIRTESLAILTQEVDERPTYQDTVSCYIAARSSTSGRLSVVKVRSVALIKRKALSGSVQATG